MTAQQDLQRFVDAQDPVYDQVCAELRAGQKRSHWMWFVFPQIEGLGQSSMARRYAIAHRAEAVAYLAHPILAPRLLQCCHLVQAVEGRSLVEIFGQIDAVKFRSCMTLFAAVSESDPIFAAALQKYCDGKADEVTLELLGPH